jgi:hypothetical protein
MPESAAAENRMLRYDLKFERGGAMSSPGPFAYNLDESQIKAERRKARQLRASQWWKRRCAKGRCYYCACETPANELTMDHIIPISRGGKSTKGNIVPACKTCNNNKKQMLPMEWEAYLQRQQNLRSSTAVDEQM